MKYFDKLLRIFCIFVILDTAYSEYIDDECDSFKAKYLNDKIRRILGENQKITSIKLQLDENFNELLRELESALIRKPKPEDACVKAEGALKKFRQFMQEYTDLKKIIEPLIKKLKSMSEDSRLDNKDKFEAFRLTLVLEDSATVDVAKNDIRMTEEFLNRILGTANASKDENTSEAKHESLQDLLKSVADILDKLNRKI